MKILITGTAGFIGFSLAKELIKNKELRKLEKAQGSVAYELDPTDRQGGYASGRGIMMKEVASAPLVKKGK